LTQGEANDTFYFIEKGVCKVMIDDKDKFMVKDGDYFGEVSLLNGTPACCTVKASSDCVLLTLNAYSF
jgi:voltage-gated potassium channel